MTWHNSWQNGSVLGWLFLGVIERGRIFVLTGQDWQARKFFLCVCVIQDVHVEVYLRKWSVRGSWSWRSQTTSVRWCCSCLHTIGHLSLVLPIVCSSMVDMEAMPESTYLWWKYALLSVPQHGGGSVCPICPLPPTSSGKWLVLWGYYLFILYASKPRYQHTLKDGVSRVLELWYGPFMNSLTGKTPELFIHKLCTAQVWGTIVYVKIKYLSNKPGASFQPLT